MNNLISILLLLASAGIFFGYIHPTYGGITLETDIREKSIKELLKEREEYLNALNKTREIEQARIGLLEKYNRIPLEQRERIEKLLPDHIDSVRLIIDVNNIASKYGMALKNIGLIDPDSEQRASTAIGPQEEHFKAIGLKFTVSGSYDNFRAFMTDLESSLRLVDISAVTFDADGDTSDYAVTLSTYRLTFNKNEHF